MNRIDQLKSIKAPVKKYGKGAKILSFKGEEWVYWDSFNRWAKLEKNDEIGDYYYGTIDTFLSLNIFKTSEFPKNHRKIWSSLENKLLIKLVLNDITIQEIAEILERSPYSVVKKAEQLLKVNFPNNVLQPSYWDKSILLAVSDSY